MNYLRIFKNSSKALRIRPSDPSESTLPLLPLQHSDSDYPLNEGKPEQKSPLRRLELRRALFYRGWWRCLATTAGILGVLTCAVVLIPFFAASSSPGDLPIIDQAIVAHEAVDALFAQQSRTLAQASSRYSLRTGRPPPPYYERWFTFAREKQCLIDEYAQIHRDFRPFYQLARDNATTFQNMIDRASRVLDDVDAEIARVEIRDGEVYMTGSTAYRDWPNTWRHFSAGLPNMTFLMNSRDEPRVAFNYRAPGSRERALLVNDSKPFQIQPRPTSGFFAQQSGCNIPMEGAGFMETANNDSGFLIASAKPGYTTDLFPMLSMAKISPCFADILFPTEYYYQRSWWSGKFDHPDNVPWDEKKPQIYWRGMSNGGMIIGNNYHHYARFKLVDLGRQHPDLMDVAITKFAETLCDKGCDRDAVIAEYNITKVGEPREDIYKYKYAIDVDGTTFSGRFLGLLRSGSLVFKSTLFEEYFNDWLRPYEHYVPVLADLSDLVEKIEWANANPDEARLIQQKGLEVARRVLTDDQNDCYLYASLVEWAQLQDYAQRPAT
ncbi:CAP10 domain-containing protein [Mycena venus]|uniref:CAP10 domain-containing protein n=1 Tax=Mycena venus TaxID=2733690 RepID=A0A8H6YL59_9AGAR|nr:CAP10 domain-containing protein [Mycena venus]